MGTAKIALVSLDARTLLNFIKEGNLSKETVHMLVDEVWGDVHTTKEPAPENTFPEFKTIQLGTGLKSAKDFQRALKENHCHVKPWAEGFLKKMPVAEHPITVELVVVSVLDLGFPVGATLRKIYERAKKLGLELCPAEVGPQLRLQYKNQPRREYLRIAMKPLPGLGFSLGMFGVERCNSCLWLNAVYGNPEHFWGDSDRWVFLRRK